MNNTEKNAEKPGEIGCFSIAVIIFFALLGGVILRFSLPIVYRNIFHPRRSVAAMQANIPQARVIFEQSIEQLDILVSGEFMVNEGRAWDNVRLHADWFMAGWSSGWNDALLLSYNIGDNTRRAFVYYYWYTIEWLSDEERDAILFLLADHELEDNYISIGVSSGVLWARLYQQRPAVLIIAYGELWPWPEENGMFLERSESLGDGYTLWVYASMGNRMFYGSSWGRFGVYVTLFGMVVAALPVIVIITINIRRKKAKSKC